MQAHTTADNSPEALVREARRPMRLYAVAKVGPGDRFLGYAPKQFFTRRRAERYAEQLNRDATDGVRYVVEQT